MRSCIKTGCRWPAAATLAYRYDTGEVWLSDLSAEDHPATHDLCPHHADTLRVPRGWTLVDQRGPDVVVREPSAAEVVERAQQAREDARRPARAERARLLRVAEDPAPPPSRARYDALLADLPPGPPAEPDTARATTAEHPADTPSRPGGPEARATVHGGAAARPAPGRVGPVVDLAFRAVVTAPAEDQEPHSVVDLTVVPPPRPALSPAPPRSSDAAVPTTAGGAENRPKPVRDADVPAHARLEGALVLPLPFATANHHDGDSSVE